MLVKVFESEDMASALKKVKETLGPDALILSTRTIRKGGLGVLGRPILEVTAAIEPSAFNNAAPRASSGKAPGRKRNETARRPAAREENDLDDIRYEDLWAARDEQPAALLAPPAKAAVPAVELDSLRGEIDELKSLVRNFMDEARRASHEAPGSQGEREPRASHTGLAHRQEARLSGEFDDLEGLLRERGIDEEAAQTIVRYAVQRAVPAQRQNLEVMRAIFSDVIGDLIQVNRPQPQKREQRRLALIGPTGVGKTTTIAKLAAEHLLGGGKNVALVTIDTFRIAAVEQLKVYGEIMNLPVEVVVSAKQMRGVLNKHSDKELILIDTAGRSPRDEVSLQNLQEILAPELRTENHLVLSAATRDQDLYETVARFSRVALHNLIFTKIDECAALGVLLNVHLRHNFPIAYLTNGQRVPEDILVADAKKIARLIMGR